MTDNFYMVQAAWCFCQRFSVLCLSKATCSLLSPTCRCVSDVWLCVLKDFSLLFQMLQGLCKEIPFLVDPQNKVQGARDSPHHLMLLPICMAQIKANHMLCRSVSAARSIISPLGWSSCLGSFLLLFVFLARSSTSPLCCQCSLHPNDQPLVILSPSYWLLSASLWLLLRPFPL